MASNTTRFTSVRKKNSHAAEIGSESQRSKNYEFQEGQRVQSIIDQSKQAD
jgi:hypothetical protein